MSSTASKKNDSSLEKLAIQARQFSHSPYSQKKVGAAIEFADGRVSTGCNIENASYGGTVCAERVAIWKHVSANKKAKIKKVIVAVDEKNPWPPCGLCLQVMAEFAGPKTEVICINLEGHKLAYSFKDLLPQAFEGKFL